MMPYFFGNSGSHLFGSYHPPNVASTTHSGVLICYPIGHEYIRSHRLLLQIAKMISRMGLHVFRFDYFGTGDSSGHFNEARISRWIDDTQTAIGEFKAVAGINTLSLLGLRFGANIASKVSEADSSIKTLLLCDPIFQPGEYLASLSGLHDRLLEDPNRFLHSRKNTHNSEHDLIGFEFTPALRQDIEQFSVWFDTHTTSTKHFIISKEPQPGACSTTRSNTHVIDLDCKWNDLEYVETVLVAPELIQQIETIVAASNP